MYYTNCVPKVGLIDNKGSLKNAALNSPQFNDPEVPTMSSLARKTFRTITVSILILVSGCRFFCNL